MTNAQAEKVKPLDQFFREVVLCLGGIFHTAECSEDLIWQITKSLDHIYRRNRERLLERPVEPDATVRRRPLEPHPAVEDVLVRIGR